MLRSLLLGTLVVSATLAALRYPGEKRLKNVRQLTFGGENAEGYFSFDDKFLTLQATGLDHYGTNCDQIYRLDLTKPPENQTLHRLSTGLGGTTCSYFYPNNKDILYAGNFHHVKLDRTKKDADTCPVKTCHSPKVDTDPKLKQLCNTSYTWDIFPDYDIFKVNEHGNILAQLTNVDGYDAEGTLSPDGRTIVFTSMRSGDLELWLMDVDGKNLRQLTNVLGYDGGAFFSRDGKKIVFRASRPKTEEEKQKYKDLLSYNLVAPTEMELFTIDVDGRNMKQITELGGANWAPFYLNDSRRIIFSSDYNSTAGFGAFNLYLINDDGTDLEQVTFGGDHTFDSFPMMSYGGTKLVWGSSRNGKTEYEMNLFLADWVDDASLFEDEQDENRVESENEVVEEMPLQSQEEPSIPWKRLKTEPYDGVIHYPGEVHLQNIKQITFGGQNAEGYFSFDDNKLTIQATGPDNYGTGCDQIYQIDLTHNPRNQVFPRMSTGLGGTTCSYFFNETGNRHTLYAGNFWNVKVDPYDPVHTCPQKKCLQKPIKDPKLAKLCDTSYTWDIFPDYDIFKVNEYGNIVQQLTNHTGYDAEGVISPDGTKIAFTSIRTGDLELFIMNSDGSNLIQVTNELGYDGGSFFSPDGKRLIFRASRPKTKEEIQKYKDLLSYNLVAPTEMELFVVDIDGQNLRQITHLGGANWAPYYLNDNKRVIFSTDFNAVAGFGAFDLYIINDDGTGLERVTQDDGQFDSFPMMSYDGTQLVWGSSRNGSMYELNLFLADWVDPPKPTGAPGPNGTPTGGAPTVGPTGKAPTGGPVSPTGAQPTGGVPTGAQPTGTTPPEASTQGSYSLSICSTIALLILQYVY